MAIDVRVTANMQNHLGGRSIQANGDNVRDLLADIDGRFLNDEDIRFLDKLDTALKDGDVVSILPALAGGS